MNRAPILDSLEAAFTRLGFTAQSEPEAQSLSMVHPDGSRMSADASKGSNYGYLYVLGRGDTILMIRLGQREPYLTPHQCSKEGRQFLEDLVKNCEPFQKDWLREYLEKDTSP